MSSTPPLDSSSFQHEGSSMNHQRVITCEQPTSLAAALQARDIQHGDTVEDVEMEGVGFRTQPVNKTEMVVLAFCPMKIVSHGSIVRASKAERALPFPSTVAWTQQDVNTLQETPFSRCGFARIKCNVRSNGSIHLSSIRVLHIEHARENTLVNQRGAYEMFRQLEPTHA